VKKICIAAIIAILSVPAAFGADFSLSAGGGGLLGGLFTRYTLTADGELDLGGVTAPVDVVSIQEFDQLNYGGYLFFDAVWVEFSVSFQGGSNTWKENYTAVTKDDGVTQDDPKEYGTGTEAMLGFTLLGKYPFRVNERLTLFPLAGLEYQIALAEYRKQRDLKQHNRTNVLREQDSNGNAYKLSAWNSLFIDIGAGMDFMFYPRLFLRTELLYGFRLQTPYEVDALDKVKKMVNAPNPKLAGLTSGPSLRVAMGYRLK
jgi:opacity protein-like surface antigen